MPMQFLKSYYLTSASHNARIAGEIEEAFGGKELQDLYRGEAFKRWQQIHDGHVMTSFISSFTAIEAAFNEFIEDEMAWSTSNYERIYRIRDEYPRFFDRISPLDKYQTLLIMLDMDPMNRGSEPFQSAQILQDVRNEFVHYKPEWLQVEGGDEIPGPNIGKSSHRIGDALKTKSRETNPFREYDSFFPGKCLSYDYARWGIESALEFLEDFYSRFSLRHPIIDRDVIEAEMDTGWADTEPRFG